MIQVFRPGAVHIEACGNEVDVMVNLNRVNARLSTYGPSVHVQQQVISANTANEG
jgi:hypothetical protein